MRKIQDKNLAQLLLQIKFTPQKKKQKQLDAAEKLFSIIDPDREYPFEFVCYHITGFHPKNLPELQPIPGRQLLMDLKIFISRLSAQIACPASEQKEEVYSIDQLAQKLNVSTKTIHRWREKGLVARKFIFQDGVRRFGFLKSSIENFIEKNPSLVKKAETFTRLTKKQKQSIIRKACLLAAKNDISRCRIIELIAEQFGRAHETIRCILRDYEAANPNKHIFTKPSGVINPKQEAEIYRLYRQGQGLNELMKLFDRSRSSIYRIINRRRAKEITGQKIDFIPSKEFLEEGVSERILSKKVRLQKFKGRSQPLKLADEPLPEYLKTIKNAPTLNREREMEFFRRYNYLKYLACITRERLNKTRPSGIALNRIEKFLEQAERIKKMIIEANLRLVVGIATRHATSSVPLQDLIGEGNYSLMRAVEKFDYTKGFRFATYASWAITKDYARIIPAMSFRPSRASAASYEGIQRDIKAAEQVNFGAIERARRNLINVIRDELDERQQYIILNHFGLIGPSLVRKIQKTLQQIGDDLNLTKERVRQIELEALQKLRQSLSIEEFELLKE